MAVKSKITNSAAKVQRFFESRKKITQKFAYVQFLLYLRTPPCYAIPPKVQPRPAGHTQRMSGIFEKGCALFLLIDAVPYASIVPAIYP